MGDEDGGWIPILKSTRTMSPGHAKSIGAED